MLKWKTLTEFVEQTPVQAQQKSTHFMLYYYWRH